MNNFKLGGLALAVSLALGSGAMAQSMSAGDYRTAQDRIESNYDAASRACESMTGTRQAICSAEAQGKQTVELAKLEAEYRPSETTRQQATMAQVEADYAVAVKRCDEQSGASKSACLNTAQSAQTDARADAGSQLRSADRGADGSAGTASGQGVGTTDRQPAGATGSTARTTAGSAPGDRMNDDPHTLLFDFGSAELRPEGREALDSFIAELQRSDSSDPIEVTGHTDRIGDDDFNQGLSERRAEAVRAYLRNEGIEASRVDTSGKGSAQPETAARDCDGERSDAVITCLQPDRRVTLASAGIRNNR
ncbi:MAG: OmpA family protein [Gammaproteobacteria bacterium]|nr:OmpA family protein [Gammaproteobacteria bacterium]